MTAGPTSPSPASPPVPAGAPAPSGPGATAAPTSATHPARARAAEPSSRSPHQPRDPHGEQARPVRPGLRLLARTWLWGWMSTVQLVTGLLLAGPYIAIGAILLAGVLSVPAAGVGIVMVGVMLPIARVVGVVERARVEAFLGVRVPPPPPPDPGTPIWRRLLLDGRAWRATLHLSVIAWWNLFAGTLVLVLVCVSLAFAALPLYGGWLPGGELMFVDQRLAAGPWWWIAGWMMLLTLPLIARGLTGVDLLLARALLGPGRDEQVERLTQRVETLTHTREMAVDSVEVERRRIERDLHDGPQQRLVAIAMDLGMAQAKLEGDPAAAKDLLDRAHTAAKEAMDEMRQVARGIHPPVLTDRGLDAALSALAARSPVPVTVQVALPARPSPTTEAIAYFCVSEALTNVAKHSGARTVTVDVRRTGGHVQIEVADDGRGGADVTRGTGLVGLRQRLAAVDGTLTVHSPPGAGTRLFMTLPERPDAPRSTL